MVRVNVTYVQDKAELFSAAKCLTATSNSASSSITLQSCSSPPTESQKWTFANGQVQVFGNKCLQVPNGTNQDGVKLQIATCDSGNKGQQFGYSVWSNTLTWKGTNKCVDLAGGNLADGSPVSLSMKVNVHFLIPHPHFPQIQIWTCSQGNPNQFWNVGYSALALPTTSQKEQTGVNNCSGANAASDPKCQTVWLNSASDFCLWGPRTFPHPLVKSPLERETEF